MEIFAAVELERPGIIHAVEIMICLQFGAHAVDLPSLDFGIEVFAERLQPADQGISGLDVGDLQRPFAERNARNLLLGGVGPDIFGAFLRQRPEFAGIFETDAGDQFADRKTVTRHHRAELVAGGVPADVAALKHGDAGAEPCGLQRHCEAGQPRPDHADIDIQIERKPRARRRLGGIGPVGRACESFVHIVFLRTDRALVTLSRA